MQKQISKKELHAMQLDMEINNELTTRNEIKFEFLTNICRIFKTSKKEQ